MEWQKDQDSRCSGCGQPFAETVGDENFDQWNARIVTCDGCRAISRTSHIAAGRDDLDPLAGARFSVWRDSRTSTVGVVSSNGEEPARPDPQP